MTQQHHNWDKRQKLKDKNEPIFETSVVKCDEIFKLRHFASRGQLFSQSALTFLFMRPLSACSVLLLLPIGQEVARRFVLQFGDEEIVNFSLLIFNFE